MSKFASRLTTICFLLAVGYSHSTLLAQTPLKVFVLVGQSNMEGHAKLSTIPHIGMDPNGKAWRTSLHVGSLVTLVAGVHYMYMREYWVQVHQSPIVYRYLRLIV